MKQDRSRHTAAKREAVPPLLMTSVETLTMCHLNPLNRPHWCESCPKPLNPKSLNPIPRTLQQKPETRSTEPQAPKAQL